MIVKLSYGFPCSRSRATQVRARLDAARPPAHRGHAGQGGDGDNKKQYVSGALNVSARQLTEGDGSSKSSDLFCKLVWCLLE